MLKPSPLPFPYPPALFLVFFVCLLFVLALAQHSFFVFPFSLSFAFPTFFICVHDKHTHTKKIPPFKPLPALSAFSSPTTSRPLTRTRTRKAILELTFPSFLSSLFFVLQNHRNNSRYCCTGYLVNQLEASLYLFTNFFLHQTHDTTPPSLHSKRNGHPGFFLCLCSRCRGSPTTQDGCGLKLWQRKSACGIRCIRRCCEEKTEATAETQASQTRLQQLS